MSFSNYVEDATLNHWLRATAAPTPPATVYLALFSTDPGEAPGPANAVDRAAWLCAPSDHLRGP